MRAAHGTPLLILLLLGLASGCDEALSAVERFDAAPYFDIGRYLAHSPFDCDTPLGDRMELQNHSADAASLDAPFDPQRPTIILVHGRNVQAPIFGCGSYTWPRDLAEVLARRIGDRANLAVFKHDVLAAARIEQYDENLPEIAAWLVQRLNLIGLTNDLHLICHSGGVEVAYLATLQLGFVRQITFLDGGASTLHKIRRSDDPFLAHVGYVENYYVAPPFGLGIPLIIQPNVTNVRITSGFDDLPINHAVPIVWYQGTIEHLEVPGGFNWSFLEGPHVGAGREFVERRTHLYEQLPDGSLVAFP